MPSITGSEEEKKIRKENKKVKEDTYNSSIEEKDPSIQKAVKNVTKISVTLDEQEVERYLTDELDIPPDDIIKINDAVSKHASRQAFYGMLHNIAKKNYKDLKKEKSNKEYEREQHIKKKKPLITEKLYKKHQTKGLKKPNKDQIQDAVDTYTDNTLKELNKEIEKLEDKILKAEKLKDDLWVAYDAFKAQKDDLITLSSNYRHDENLFKGLNKKKK